MIFFFSDYDKIHKKQKFSALGIAESQSKEMWLISYATCVDIIAQVFLTPRSVFLFLAVATLKVRIIIIFLTPQPVIILSTVHTTKNSVAFV